MYRESFLVNLYGVETGVKLLLAPKLSKVHI
jgi:hypothetical protein